MVGLSKDRLVIANPWAALRAYTPARIALGRAGNALPTDEVLRFGLAHARARDAVHAALDTDALAAELRALGLAVRIVKSAAPDRATYLLRPDLGRKLAQGCLLDRTPAPIALAIEDGLSAIAVQRHAAPLLRALIEPSAAWAGAAVIARQEGRSGRERASGLARAGAGADRERRDSPRPTAWGISTSTPRRAHGFRCNECQISARGLARRGGGPGLARSAALAAAKGVHERRGAVESGGRARKPDRPLNSEGSPRCTPMNAKGQERFSCQPCGGGSEIDRWLR